jgi:predicted MFS family arabinose efflux permease
MLIGNMGSILAGAPLTYMAEHTGWRGVFVAVGVVSLLLGVACWAWVRDPAKTYVSYAAVKGSLLSVVKNRYTWPATLVNAGVSGSFFAFGGLWAAPFLMVVHGMERSTASAHLSVYFTGFALGCLLIGSISDRLRKRKLVAIVASHLYCAIWLFWLTGTQLPLIGSYIVIGVMGLSAAAFILTWACAKEVNPPQLSGMSTAVTNMGGFSAAAVLQPLVGYVIDLHWNGTMADGVRVYSPEDMRLGLLLLAGTAIVGAISTWFLKETGCRNIWNEN